MNGKFARAGRGLLGWNQSELAAKAGLNLNKIRAFEAGGEPSVPPSTVSAIRRALENGGVIFRADGSLDSAEQLLDRYASLAAPTPDQTAQAIVASGVVRRAGGRRAMPTGKAAAILEAGRKARNENDQ
jgi:transcriptional regulator with XRE-family HTH domain